MPLRSKRHILFLNWRDTTHPSGGGSERYVEQLAERLAADGDEVTILCAAHGVAAANEERAGVTIRRAGGTATVYLHGLRAVRRHRPDIVVDVLNGIPFFAPLVHRRVLLIVHHLNREPWVSHFGRVLGRLGWWVESTVVRRLYRRCPVVAVSAPTRDELVALGIEADRIVVAHNVTDPTPPTDVRPAPTPTLCVLSRLVAHKQAEHAVDVVARLVPDFPDLRLRVIGEGPTAGQIQQRAAALGVASHVQLLGFLDERAKHEVLAESWVLLVPSQKEGWARVVMEAALHRVPSIAYRSAGGLRESIRDGQTGLLVDSLDDMVEQTRALLRDPARRIAMGEAAREYAAGFTIERTIDEFRRALDDTRRVPV